MEEDTAALEIDILTSVEAMGFSLEFQTEEAEREEETPDRMTPDLGLEYQHQMHKFGLLLPTKAGIHNQYDTNGNFSKQFFLSQSIFFS